MVLGLGTENSLIADIKDLPELINASSAYEYNQKEVQFVLAENRQIFSSSAKIEGELGLLSQKDDYLRFQASERFLFETIESDKRLKEHMLALKEAHDSIAVEANEEGNTN